MSLNCSKLYRKKHSYLTKIDIESVLMPGDFHFFQKMDTFEVISIAHLVIER